MKSRRWPSMAALNVASRSAHPVGAFGHHCDRLHSWGEGVFKRGDGLSLDPMTRSSAPMTANIGMPWVVADLLSPMPLGAFAIGRWLRGAVRTRQTGNIV